MTHSLPSFQNMSVVCKTEPDETEILPEPACGRMVKKEEEEEEKVKEEEEKGFVVKEEEEEQKVFQAEDVDDAVLPGECVGHVTTIEQMERSKLCFSCPLQQ